MIWSYSFLNTYATCQKQAYHRYIAKDLPREPASPEMSHGIAVHDAFEKRLKTGEPFPESMATYERFAAAIEVRGRPQGVELQLGITADGAPTSFFAKDVWGRGKVDVLLIDGSLAFMPDWKTGRKREDPFELETFGLLVQAHFPDLIRILGHYVWLRDGTVGPAHDVSDTAGTFRQIRSTMDAIEAQTKQDYWPAAENPLCGWCPVTACRFNKRGSR